MRWCGVWQEITYQAYDVVRDGGWLMVANKETTDRAAPIATGFPSYIYSGAAPTAAASAGQVVFGSRYQNATQGLWISSLRLFVVNGGEYEVFIRPGSSLVGESVANFTAASTGWLEVPIRPWLVPPGARLDIVAQTTPISRVPVDTTADYNYVTPQNTTVPTPGQITHAQRDATLMLVHRFDGDTADRRPLLQSMKVGDEISIGGTVWYVQAVTDNGDYFTFSVIPAVVEQATYVTVTFSVFTQQDVTLMRDIDYWASSSSVSGLYALNGTIYDVVPDDNAYGVDVMRQPAVISPDWDFMAYTDVSRGGGVA
jgi:hypothetical protein